MLTLLPASPSLPRPSTQRIHVLSSKKSWILSHATGDHILFKHQITDQQPLRSDIYIRHAPSVSQREPALPSSPRSALVPASLLPAVWPGQPAGERPLGEVTSAYLSCSPTHGVLGPRAPDCLHNFLSCPASVWRWAEACAPFSNNGIQWGRTEHLAVQGKPVPFKSSCLCDVVLCVCLVRRIKCHDWPWTQFHSWKLCHSSKISFISSFRCGFDSEQILTPVCILSYWDRLGPGTLCCRLWTWTHWGRNLMGPRVSSATYPL